MTPISIFFLISLLEGSNHQDEEHSLIARYAARLAADAAVRYTIYKTFIAHKYQRISHCFLVPKTCPWWEKGSDICRYSSLDGLSPFYCQGGDHFKRTCVAVNALAGSWWMAGDLTALLPPMRYEISWRMTSPGSKASSRDVSCLALPTGSTAEGPHRPPLLSGCQQTAEAAHCRAGEQEQVWHDRHSETLFNPSLLKLLVKQMDQWVGCRQ